MRGFNVMYRLIRHAVPLGVEPVESGSEADIMTSKQGGQDNDQLNNYSNCKDNNRY